MSSSTAAWIAIGAAALACVALLVALWILVRVGKVRAAQDVLLGGGKSDLVDFVLIGPGRVRGEALQDFVNRMVGERPIERLVRPFAVVATEARSGRMTVFNHGNTGLAVRASASVPNLFIAPVIDGEEFIDGGLTSPVPVKVARAMGADVVVAVDVSWFAQVRAQCVHGARVVSLHAAFGAAHGNRGFGHIELLDIAQQERLLLSRR